MHKAKRQPLNEDTKGLGRRIRCLRSLLDLTQKEMGQKLGCPAPYTQNWVCRLETGLCKNVNFQVFVRLARLALQYNLGVEWLILGSGSIYNAPEQK